MDLIPSIDLEIANRRENLGTFEKQFIEFAKGEIEKINAEIAEYNKETVKESQLSRLRTINKLRRALEDKYPEDTIIKAFDDLILIGLFNACKEEFAKFGLGMHEVNEEDASELSNTPLAQLIANLEPEALAEMLAILNFKRNQQNKDTKVMEIIREKWDLFIKKYPVCEAVFEHYQMDYQGGGNAKNYKFTSTDPNNPHEIILRVDGRIGGARQMDTYLKTTPLKKALPPTAAARMISYGENTREKRTLLITKVFSGGTPLADSKRCQQDDERMHHAVALYRQMANILLDIQKQGCFIPDAKNENWFIDEEGNLCIGDPKSTIFADENAYHDQDATLEKNRWIYGKFDYIIQSLHYSPPEFDGSRFAVNTAHSFILGKNIYQYLTSCESQSLCEPKKNRGGQRPAIHDGKELDFSSPIFNSEAGKTMKQLICDLVRPIPEQRQTVQYAMRVIETLQQQLASVESPSTEVSTPNDTGFADRLLKTQPRATLNDLIAELEACQLVAPKPTNNEQQPFVPSVEHDAEMQRYIAEFRRRVTKAEIDIHPDTEPLRNEILKTIKENKKMLSFLSQVLTNIQNSQSFHLGKPEKIQSILHAYAAVPVTERGNLMQTTTASEAVLQVHRALGTWRTYFGNFQPCFVSMSSIFHKYKQQFDVFEDPTLSERSNKTNQL